ncbi:hypothetical protein [Neobacillus sp. D3-1R]|uniref:hypothetical protein n=1 Tax=Neobacillus sp. D3-1R TaxID=3445778 RepID=UPI003FA1811E
MMYGGAYYNAYPPYGMYRHPQYPPVDISILSHSVTAFQKIANESIRILKKLAEPEFARRLMTAAQMGNQREVDRLVKSIGSSTPITTTYTPSGLLLTIHAEAQGTQCCTLTMFLKWGR